MRRRPTALLIPMAGGVGTGPLAQLLAIAEACELAGWRCVLACSSEAHVGVSQRSGFETYALPPPEPRPTQVVDFRLSDVLYSAGVIDRDYMRMALAGEGDLVSLTKPDVIISASNITAPITAQIHGLPSVAIAAGPDSAGFISPLYSASDGYLDAASEEANSVLEELALPPVKDASELAFQRANFRVAPTWPEFDPVLVGMGEPVSFVGPLISASLELRSSPSPPTEPFVAIYLNRGRSDDSEERGVVEQLTDTFPEHQMVWIGGPDDHRSSVGSVPMYRWLNRASLLVSGGGYNTLLSAVERGVPSLVFPARSAERYYNALQVVSQGCGSIGQADNVVSPALEAMALSERAILHQRSGAPMNGAHRVVEQLLAAIG